MPNYGASSYGFSGNVHQDPSSYGSFSSNGNGGDLHMGHMGHGFNTDNVQHSFAQSVPISEHVEVTKPVAVPVVKNIGKILHETLQTQTSNVHKW